MLLEESFEKKPVRTGTKVVLAIFGIILVISLLGIIAKAILYPAAQAERIMEKTLDADNVLYNYEYFKQTYRDIGAADAKIKTAEEQVGKFEAGAGPRSDWDFRDKEEYGRLTANVTGLKNFRNDLIATYNARAKMVNRSIFIGRDVPSSIDQ